ncbi:MAG TPA: cobalamin-independent methionine synthase II family protein [Chloroflexota bacterium]
MQRSTANRILTTHVGNLPAPIDLQPDAPDYAARLAEAVRQVVHKQAEIGLDIVNDGELSKGNWLVYAANRLGGFEPRQVPAGNATIAQGKDREEFAAFYEEAGQSGTLFHSSWRQTTSNYWATHFFATAPITYVGQALVQRDVDNLRAALGEVDGRLGNAFLPVTAPASLEVYRTNEYYSSERDFLYALAEALKEEYDAIARAGLLVQIDDAWTVALWDRIGLQMGLEAFQRRAMLRQEVLNHALRDIPQEQIRYHICWGSWHGPHAFDLPLKDAVEIMLGVKAGAYLFEAANVRHEHEYHVWEDVRLPAGKILVPGVVTHSTNLIEHPDLVAERIRRFVRLVGAENVIAGTDCGMGGRIHPQLAWAKLGALVEGARRASD